MPDRIEKKCLLCRGFCIVSPLATYQRWEQELAALSADYIETRRIESLRLWQIKIQNIQTRGKPCMHCCGKGYRKKVLNV